MCPSRELTLTPRQRIVVRREIARLTAEEPRSPALAELTSDFGYAALDTCATDGLCALACPVGIDTGALVKRLRRERRSDAAEELAARLAERLGWIEPLARAALAVASAFDRRLPLPARASTDGARRDEARAVCFPGCVSRVIGPDRGRAGEATVAELVGRVAARAGVPVYVPRDAAGTCCGLAFGSKGYAAARQLAVNRTVERLWDWSAGGALPVIVDSSPCALALKSCRPDLSDVNRDRFDRLAILDGIEFARELLRAGLAPRRVRRSVTVHPVCSVRKMELVSPLLDVLRGCADRVDTPLSAGCCGFAGDRGFRVPELTAAATRAEAAEVCANGHDGHYSSSRTCEIALGRATGRSYESFWALLEEATRPV
jgi:D-lactate dehydrogenase